MAHSTPTPTPTPTVAGAQTLINGLEVLKAVAHGAHDVPSAREVVGLPRSTVQRLVAALKSEGFLRESGQGLVLGPALISLGFAAIGENPLVEVAAPIIDELARETRDTVHLAVEEQRSVLYLAKIPGRRGAETRSRVGLRMPLTRTGIGKALLLREPEVWRSQFLAEAPAVVDENPTEADADAFVETMGRYRALGFTLDLEENEPGVRCVAVPVYGPEGGLVAAISVTATTPYMAAARMRALVPAVTKCAERIGRAIGREPGVTTGDLGQLPAELLDEVFDFE